MCNVAVKEEEEEEGASPNRLAFMARILLYRKVLKQMYALVEAQFYAARIDDINMTLVIS